MIHLNRKLGFPLSSKWSHSFPEGENAFQIFPRHTELSTVPFGWSVCQEQLLHSPEYREDTLFILSWALDSTGVEQHLSHCKHSEEDQQLKSKEVLYPGKAFSGTFGHFHSLVLLQVSIMTACVWKNLAAHIHIHLFRWQGTCPPLRNFCLSI